MLPVPKMILDRWRGGAAAGGAPVSRITTVKNGTFSFQTIGPVGTSLKFNPGDGSSSEVIPMTGGSYIWTHAYDGAGYTITITGDVDKLTYLNIDNQSIISSFGDLIRYMFNVGYFRCGYNNLMTGSLSSISSKHIVNGWGNMGVFFAYGCSSLNAPIGAMAAMPSLDYHRLDGTSASYTERTTLPPWTGHYHYFFGCGLSTPEVDNLTIDVADGGMHDTNYQVQNNSPRTSLSDDAIVTLILNNVAVTIDE